MLDMDGRPHGDFSGVAIGLLRDKTCVLHESDHVRSRQDGGQLAVVRTKRVLELDQDFGFCTSANGNRSRHRNSIL